MGGKTERKTLVRKRREGTIGVKFSCDRIMKTCFRSVNKQCSGVVHKSPYINSSSSGSSLFETSECEEFVGVQVNNRELSHLLCPRSGQCFNHCQSLCTSQSQLNLLLAH